jgi:hypothetical protein
MRVKHDEHDTSTVTSLCSETCKSTPIAPAVRDITLRGNKSGEFAVAGLRALEHDASTEGRPLSANIEKSQRLDNTTYYCTTY